MFINVSGFDHTLAICNVCSYINTIQILKPVHLSSRFAPIQVYNFSIPGHFKKLNTMDCCVLKKESFLSLQLKMEPILI